MRNDPCLTHGPDGIVGAIGVIDMELLSVIGDHEEVCGAGDGVGPGAVCLAGAQTFEVVESQR